MENKFKKGDVVRAKINPALKLVVRRYIRKIYFCKIFEDSERQEFAYFERELISDSDYMD